MKRSRTTLRVSYVLILAGFVGLGHRLGWTEPGQKTAMVFDPQTNKYFVGGEAQFSIKQGEGTSLIDRIEVSVDGNDYQPYNGAIKFTKEGKHTLKFRAISPVNNWAPVQFTEVFVDMTAPSTKAIFSELRYFRDDKTLYAAVGSHINLQAQDNLSGVSSVEFSWDGMSFSAYEQPILIEKIGAQALFYRAKDRVGNTEMPQRVEFVADGTAPVSELKIQGAVKPAVIDGRNYLSASDSVAFAVDAADPIKGDGGASKVKLIWISLDGKPAAAYQRPVYFLQEGPHTLTYFAEDNVGNKEEPKSVNIYTVSTPPRTIATAEGKIVNTGGVNFAARDFVLKLNAKDNVVGLDRIEIKVDHEEQFRTYLEPIRFTEPGLHKVTYRAVDRAGNQEPTRTYSVIIQTEPPETTIESAQPMVTRDGITYSPSPNIITFNVKNRGVGVEKTLYSLNDGPFLDYTGPITLTSQQRQYKIFYKSIDKLGNEEKNKALTVHMIGSSPVVDLFVSDGANSEERVRTNYFDTPMAQPSQATTGDPLAPTGPPATTPAQAIANDPLAPQPQQPAQAVAPAKPKARKPASKPAVRTPPAARPGTQAAPPVPGKK